MTVMEPDQTNKNRAHVFIHIESMTVMEPDQTNKNRAHVFIHIESDDGDGA
jgi:hypothetical protein